VNVVRALVRSLFLVFPLLSVTLHVDTDRVPSEMAVI